MRRLLVIFLILLFPLNVLALSISVSTAQPDGAHTHASMTSSDAFQGNANADIDPDEPPSVADLHDLVHQDTRLNLAGLRAAAVPQHAAPPYRLSLPPPDKPPRRA